MEFGEEGKGTEVRGSKLNLTRNRIRLCFCVCGGQTATTSGLRFRLTLPALLDSLILTNTNTQLSSANRLQLAFSFRLLRTLMINSNSCEMELVIENVYNVDESISLGKVVGWWWWWFVIYLCTNLLSFCHVRRAKYVAVVVEMDSCQWEKEGRKEETVIVYRVKGRVIHSDGDGVPPLALHFQARWPHKRVRSCQQSQQAVTNYTHTTLSRTPLSLLCIYFYPTFVYTKGKGGF